MLTRPSDASLPRSNSPNESVQKSHELHTTIRLAKLLAEQRHRKRARTILSEIYGWFTEGFDTRDLKEAKSLLEDLKP